ncbi:MAG: FHA domain-containing protein [Pseudomonadota bacterium]
MSGGHHMLAMEGAGAAAAAPLALLEVLDRDGHVRHQLKVRQWPLRVGRALDNDWVLDDPHTAAHHFSVSVAPEGGPLQVAVGDSVNGLWVERRWLPARAVEALTAPVAWFKAGETVFRLRTAALSLAPELPLEASPAPLRGRPVLGVTAVLGVAALGLRTWLTTDPDEDWLNVVSIELLITVGLFLAWCGLWALLSKVMTRRANLDWHVRVALLANLAWEVSRVVPGLLGFSFSQPWIANFGFVLPLMILAWAVTWHMRQVEPRRPGRRQALGVLTLTVGLFLSLGANLSTNNRWGQGLYLTHLYPPSLRLAPAQELDSFMDGVAGLKEQLDDKAAEPADEEGPEATLSPGVESK